MNKNWEDIRSTLLHAVTCARCMPQIHLWLWCLPKSMQPAWQLIPFHTYFLKEANTLIIVVTQTRTVKRLCCEHRETLSVTAYFQIVSCIIIDKVDNKKYNHIAKIANWKPYIFLRSLFSTLCKCVHVADVWIKIECSEDRSVPKLHALLLQLTSQSLVAKSQCSATAQLRFHQKYEQFEPKLGLPRGSSMEQKCWITSYRWNFQFHWDQN